MSLSFLIASVSAGPPNTTGVGPIPSPSPALTIGECVGSLLALDPPINLRNFENYDSWFDEHSSMTVAQTGTYIGVDDIKEYVRFGFPSSPYIAARGTILLTLTLTLASPNPNPALTLSLTPYRPL